MTDQVSSLVIRISSEDAQKAVDALKALGIQAETTEKQVNSLGKGSGESTAQLANAYAGLKASSEKYIAALERQVNIFGATREEIAKYDTAVRGLTGQEQQYAASLGRTLDSMQFQEAETKKLVQAQDSQAKSLDNLLAKLKQQADFTTKTTAEKLLSNVIAKGANEEQLKEASASIAVIAAHEKETAARKAATAATTQFTLANSGSIRELIVIARELGRGDYTRLGGSLSILAQRSGLLAAALTPVGLGISAVVTALGALVFAENAGEKETLNLYKSMILTGDSAGVTFSQLTNAAKGIASVAGTQHQAAEALAELTGSGAVAAESIEKFGLVAIKLNRDVGDKIGNVVKTFEQLGRSPVEASIKLNESLHYLTASVFDNIKALADQGKESEAAAAAQNAFADAMLNRTAQIEARLGTLGKAWRGIADAAAYAWNAMLNVGREKSLDEKLIDAAQSVAEARAVLAKPSSNNPFDGGSDQASRKRAQDQIADGLALQQSLSRQKLLTDNVATSQRAVADQAERHIKFVKDGERFLSENDKKAREIAVARNSGEDAELIKKRIADIEASYARKSTAKGVVTEKDLIGVDISQLKSAFDKLNNAYKDSSNIVKAYHAAGKLDDADFYKSKVAFIRLEAEALRSRLEAENEVYAKGAKNPKSTPKDRLNDQKKIDENNQKITDSLEKQKAATLDLDIAESARTLKLLQSYKDLKSASDKRIEDLISNQKKQASNFGIGDEERARIAGVKRIEDSYDKQLDALKKFKADRSALTDNKQLNAEDQKYYDLKVDLLTNEQARELAIYDVTYKQKRDLEASYHLGALDALQNYLDRVNDKGKQAQQLVAQSLTGFDDAATKAIFGDGGKAFKNLGKTVAQEIVKGIISSTITAPIANWLKNQLLASGGSGGGGGIGGILGLIFGGGGAGGAISSGSGFANVVGDTLAGAATGGSIQPNSIKQINEGGTELISSGGKQYLATGNQPATVTPHESSGGAGGGVVIDQSGSTYNVGQGVSRAEVAAAVAQGQAQTESRIRRLMANGNMGSR